MSEQRLIDANALGKILSQRYKEMEAKNGPYDHYVSGFDDAITYVEDAPTIDAVPVVHARWLPRGSDDYDAGMYYCSACKDERYFGDEVFTSEEAEKYDHYCPNCGAKMDGGATDV